MPARSEAMTQDRKQRPRRIKGHKLTLTWSGEYGEESSSTATCSCGWWESASNQRVCREEYNFHLDVVWERMQPGHWSQKE